ncbi:reverse transcriptase domain-containing protein [Tanacetum coccineum]
MSFEVATLRAVVHAGDKTSGDARSWYMINGDAKFVINKDLEVCNSLADSGASINLMPLSIHEKLGIGPLKPTRITLELANRSVTFLMGIAEDVFVKVEKFNFLADFVIVDFEADPRVPIILGRPFLRTAKALVDLYEEKLTLRKSSGSATSHSDLSLLEYESFHFDLLIDPLPPADRSDSQHEEFADELAHIISPPEYEHFYFNLEADPGELTRVLRKNISDTSTKDLTVNELNDFPLLLSDCDSSFSEEFSEIDLLVSFPSGNKDKIFDPGIFTIKGVQSQRFHIFPLDDFSTISFVSDSLFLTDPSEIENFLSFPSGNEDKVFDLGILIIDGVFFFTRKSPHLLNDNFKIDKRHISSEASLKIKSLICFHPKDKEIRGESS